MPGLSWGLRERAAIAVGASCCSITGADSVCQSQRLSYMNFEVAKRSSRQKSCDTVGYLNVTQLKCRETAWQCDMAQTAQKSRLIARRQRKNELFTIEPGMPTDLL